MQGEGTGDGTPGQDPGPWQRRRMLREGTPGGEGTGDGSQGPGPGPGRWQRRNMRREGAEGGENGGAVREG